LTEEEEQQAASGGGGGRPKREDRGPRQQQQQQQRRDDSAVLNALQDKGWDPNTFVEGEVVNTADFGAFVRIDASKLNSEVEGQLDGLVHISSLSKGRADSVSAFAKAGDKVQVRCKGIQKGKVSLSMIAPEDEQQPRGGGGNKGPTEGAKDWKEQLEKLQSEMPEFKNGPSVIDMRK
jgi:predicted RNA-binding protein with RPS1 domain